MTRPVSIVADTAGMDELRTNVAAMCDQIKDSLVGASAEYLHTAEARGGQQYSCATRALA